MSIAAANLGESYGIDHLVLLPGMDGTGKLFNRFSTALDPGIEVDVVRYPGDRRLGYAELLELVMERLPTDRRYALLAESFAGPLGVELAARAPAGPEALVLCCTFVRNPRPGLRALRSMIPALPLGAWPIAAVGFALMGHRGDESLRAAFFSALGQVHGTVLQARLRAVLEVDLQRQSRDALIVATTSLIPPSYLSTYAASKGFLLRFAVGLREEVDRHGVNVSALCAGPTESELRGDARSGGAERAYRPAAPKSP